MTIIDEGVSGKRVLRDPKRPPGTDGLPPPPPLRRQVTAGLTFSPPPAPPAGDRGSDSDASVRVPSPSQAFVEDDTLPEPRGPASSAAQSGLVLVVPTLVNGYGAGLNPA